MKKRKINRAKQVDRQCGNHGSCSYCRKSRLYQSNKEQERINSLLKEFKENE